MSGRRKIKGLPEALGSAEGVLLMGSVKQIVEFGKRHKESTAGGTHYDK